VENPSGFDPTVSMTAGDVSMGCELLCTGDWS
jgi:hypothetical protein